MKTLNTVTKNLSQMCKIEASGTFLTEYLERELLNGDNNAISSFIDDKKWQPVEDFETEQVISMIDDLACSMEKFITHSILGKLPNYSVIWHYEEDKSPILFTCRAESKEEAEALLYEELIDHSSNAVDFKIDSIDKLTL